LILRSLAATMARRRDETAAFLPSRRRPAVPRSFFVPAPAGTSRSASWRKACQRAEKRWLNKDYEQWLISRVYWEGREAFGARTPWQIGKAGGAQSRPESGVPCRHPCFLDRRRYQGRSGCAGHRNGGVIPAPLPARDSAGLCRRRYLHTYQVDAGVLIDPDAQASETAA